MTDPLLYGHNPQEHIVAVSPAPDGRMRVYFRTPDGTRSADHDFFPFFFLTDRSLLAGFQQRHWIKELSGTNAFKYICAFTGWASMWEAVHAVIGNYNSGNPSPAESFRDLPSIHLRPDPVSQFMIQTGMTLFKGMTYADLHRLQVAVKALAAQGARSGNPDRTDDRIVMIALSDNRGWQSTIDGRESDERTMLADFVAAIQTLDPDVIEGHSIWTFDLPYILKRCELHGIDCAIGRDAASVRHPETRQPGRDRQTEDRRPEIPGRHVIDTLQLAQLYDASGRPLESTSLRSLAEGFGIAGPDRIRLQEHRLTWYWHHEPDLVARSAAEETADIGHLSATLSQSAFYLTQMLPFNYSIVAVNGSSAKVESLLIREYVRMRHSIPRPDTAIQTTGGYTDIFYTGVFGPVLDVDVESLYPSIMIREEIAPAHEPLGVFPLLLRHLTAARLEAKRDARAAADTTTQNRLDALQGSLKILINSFYGYLGYARALFSDASAADRVTTMGQELLRRLIRNVTAGGGTCIEVDTDGIYFVPPKSVAGTEAEQAFVTSISTDLPSGINLRLKGTYRAMLSYKKKNYALRGMDERIVIKGSSLHSRGLERFGRNFVAQCIEAILNENIQRLHDLYVNLHQDISMHRLSAADFARTEVLRDTYAEYQEAVGEGKRNRQAAYEVASEAGLSWKRGEAVSYYLTGTEAYPKGFEQCKLAEAWRPEDPDENTAYYLRRLDELAAKFETLFQPSDFRAVFSVEDLFGFSPDSVRLVRRKVESSDPQSVDPEGPDPTIWLDDRQ